MQRNWKQKRIWTREEDSVLRMLREERKLTKWSHISQIMEQEFGIKQKSGKKCRQRYQNYLNAEVEHREWTANEQELLLRLHNEKGNKWVEIARVLQRYVQRQTRSDNSVKNHYHSRLRKSLRRINRFIAGFLKNEFKPLKSTVINRIVQAAKLHCCLHKDPVDDSVALKNQILAMGLDQELTAKDVLQMRELISTVQKFNRKFNLRTNKIEASKEKCRWEDTLKEPEEIDLQKGNDLRRKQFQSQSGLADGHSGMEPILSLGPPRLHQEQQAESRMMAQSWIQSPAVQVAYCPLYPTMEPFLFAAQGSLPFFPMYPQYHNWYNTFVESQGFHGLGSTHDSQISGQGPSAGMIHKTP